MSWRNRPRGPIRYATAKSKTGIPGVCMGMVFMNGRKVLHYVANCGRCSKKFNAEQLGRAEAMRRALKLRAAYEQGWKGATS